MNQAVPDTVENLSFPEELLEAVTSKAQALYIDVVGYCEPSCF